MTAQTTTVQTQPDPWATAETAKPRDFEYYGEMRIDCWFAFFPGNGSRPIPWDGLQHPVEKQVTMVDIQIFPVPEQNITYPVKYSFTDFSTDWLRIMLPSIKATGIDLRNLVGRFVKVTQVEGHQLRDKKDPSKGHYNTIKLVEVFENEDACRAAFLGLKNNLGAASVQQAAPAQAAPAAAPANGTNKEKETAAKFLKPIIENAVRGQTDLGIIQATVAANLANMPPVAKWFTVDSPEVTNEIFEAMSK